MKCPIDNTELNMTDRQGIEIDYCPQCRGVWLDRGELDKIIERTDQPSVSPETTRNYDHVRYQEPEVQAHQPRYEEPRRTHQTYDSRYDGQNQHKRHKKEGFLGELFDF